MVIDPAELDSVQPAKTKTIDIEDFVDLEEIDPIFYDHPYYLAPGPGGAKPYRLLLEAMRDTNRVAIAKVVIRQKESLVAIRPLADHDVLEMATMLFADEVVDPARLDDIPAAEDVKTNKREIDIAKQLDRVAGRRVRADQVQGHLPRGRPRDDREEGRRRGDRHRSRRGRGGRAGPRPHERAEGEPRRGARAHGDDDGDGDDAKPKRKRAGGEVRRRRRPRARRSSARRTRLVGRIAGYVAGVPHSASPVCGRSTAAAPACAGVKRGRGFSILDPDGERVEEPEVLTRVDELVIPPAWEDVWICPYPGGHIQATGIDQRGRKQYLYHPRWRARRDQAKFDGHGRLRPHAARAARARRGRPRRASDFSRDHVLALCRAPAGPRLLPDRLRGLRGDQRDLRPGDDEEAPRAGRATASCTSTTPPSTASAASRPVVDPDLGEDLCRLKRRRGGGDELLAYKRGRRWVDVKSADINAWLKDATGEDVWAKDFRTWGATVLAAVGLAVSPVPPTKTARKRAMARVVKEVAHYLGNTPAVARASYIDPRTFDRYLDGVTIAGTLPGLAEAGDGTAIQGAVEDAVLELLTGEDSPAMAPPGGEEIAAELAKAA